MAKKTNEKEGMVYRVVWADGRGVQYFDNIQAAKEFAAQPDRDAQMPELIKKPKGARVKSECPKPIEEAKASSLSGPHEHPHAAGVQHEHPGLPAGGDHDHASDAGIHRHAPEHPQEGGHLNIGRGEHDHLLAKGLKDYVEWAADAHFPSHKWLPGHTKTWIRHVEVEGEFREATREQWVEHVLWNTHSSGRANAETHQDVFVNESTRFIEKEYEFEDGSRRPATAEDFDAEEEWFLENTPAELAKRLSESGIDPDLNALVKIEGERVREELKKYNVDPLIVSVYKGSQFAAFDVESYRPTKMTEAQLKSDFQLLVGKFLRMKKGQKTEFGTIGDLISFSEKIVKEIISRGVDDFLAPPNSTTAHLLRESLKQISTCGILTETQPGREMADGAIRVLVTPRKSDLYQNFNWIITESQAIACVRFGAPEYIDLEEFAKRESHHKISEKERKRLWPKSQKFWIYTVRDLVQLPSPQRVIWDRLAISGDFAMGVKPVVSARESEIYNERLPDTQLKQYHKKIHIDYAGATECDRPIFDAEHARIRAEMERRGIMHEIEGDLDKGRGPGNKMNLEEILEARISLGGQFGPQKTFLAIVGGRVTEAEEKEILVWMNTSGTEKDTREAVKRNLRESAPEGTSVRFVEKAPFDCFIPLANLKIETIEPDARALQKIRETLVPGAKESGDASFKEQKIRPGRFFYMPQARSGVRDDDPREPANVFNYVSENQFPLLIQPEADGARVQIHKEGDSVKLFFKSGKEINPELVPELIKATRNMPSGKFVADTRIEIVIGAKRLGRSEVAGYLKGKTHDPEMDQNMVANIQDLVINGEKDYTKIPAVEGASETGKISGKHLKGMKSVVARSKEDALKAIENAARPPAKGALIKMASHPYPITDQERRSGKWWTDFPREEEIKAQVVQKLEVPGTKGVWAYIAGVRGSGGKLVPVGKTFNTRLNAKVGDTLLVAFANLNKHVDPETGKAWYAWVFPRVLEIASGAADTAERADSLVKKTAGIEDSMARPEELARLFEAAEDCMPIRSAKSARKKNPSEYPIGFFRISHHFRRKSVHKDLRIRIDEEFLSGWTITDQPAGAVKSEPEDINDAYAIVERIQFKFRPGMNPAKQVVATPKGRQPLEWMNAINMIIPPGEVGSTADGPGIFTLCDEGRLALGVQKKDFKEYFLEGKVYKGRMIVRRASEAEDGAGWRIATNLKDQVPNIMNPKERRKPAKERYMPKEGEKAIPPDWEKVIRPKFRWWARGLKPAERARRLDLAFNEMVDLGKVMGRKLKLDASGGRIAESIPIGSLRRFSKKGEGAAPTWTIMWKDENDIREIKFREGMDPVKILSEGGEVSAILKEVRDFPPEKKSPEDWLGLRENKAIPVGHLRNPNGSEEVFSEQVDSGRLTLNIDEETGKRMELGFWGKSLKGTFEMTECEKEKGTWIVTHKKSPNEK